tara:strand:+ start:54 stop:659 length:606 start_codon:yes stop_codon:yes gene_type:complete
MTTPSGQIDMNQMHLEAGGGSGTQCSLNDIDIRQLGFYYSPGGQMNFLQMRSKTRGYHNLVGTQGSASSSVPPSPVGPGSTTVQYGVRPGSYGSFAGSDSTYSGFGNSTAGKTLQIYRINSQSTGTYGPADMIFASSPIAGNGGWGYVHVNSPAGNYYFYRTSGSYATFGSTEQWTYAGTQPANPSVIPFPTSGTFNFYTR